MKIYSNDYITDFTKLKTAIIGFEFEFYTDRSYFKLNINFKFPES